MLPMIFARIVRVKKAELNRFLLEILRWKHTFRESNRPKLWYSTDILPLRKRTTHVLPARTESNLTIYEAEFRLDLIVGFVAKTVITNHGEVHDGRSQ
jgi:hypothetical protein